MEYQIYDTVLLSAGMAVFIYIFYSLTEYGSVVARDDFFLAPKKDN